MTARKLFIGIALISLATTALAFGSQWGDPGPGRGYRMAQELNLTAEQQEQVQDLRLKHREEGQVWREQHRKDMKTKLRAILTAEQLDKFISFKQQAPYGRGRGGYDRRAGNCNMNP